MLIFDAHLDMAWNALEWNRDLMKPVSEIREFEKHFDDIVPGDCTVSWADLRRGRVGIMIVTVLARLNRKQPELTFYQSREAEKRQGKKSDGDHRNGHTGKRSGNPGCGKSLTQTGEQHHRQSKTHCRSKRKHHRL